MKKIIILPIVSFVVMATIITLTYVPFIKEVITTPSYYSYQINHVDIKQESFTVYDLTIDFKDDENVLYPNVEIFISTMENNQTEETSVEYDVIDDTYYIDDYQIENRGDYFITIFFTDNDEEKETVLPITFPKMKPKIYINNGLSNLLFEVDGKTSWSSFIDPEGINLYRSSEYNFSDKAKLIEKNIRILDHDYLDLNSTDLEPYYYIQFVSKGGIVTYTSSALFSDTTQSNFNAQFITNFSGTTFLELTGNIYGPESDNTQAVRNIALRVGNYPMTEMVENTYQGEDNTSYRFLIDCEELLKEGSNDLVFFYIENGTMLEASVEASEFDIQSLQTKINGSVYTLDNPNALVLNRNYDITYTNLDASYVVEDEKVYLRISGNAYLNDASLIESVGIQVKGIRETFNTTDITNGSFELKCDLTNLETSGNWQDITFILEEDGEIYRVNLPSDEMAKTPLTHDGIVYEFESWNNQLKVHKHIEN